MQPHAMQIATPQPFARSAYIHVPFCAHHCGYCNFTVIAGRDDLVRDYLRAIELEVSQLPSVQPLDTLYLGGGTPTRLSGDALRRLFEIVRSHLSPAAGCEITVEANPADLDAAKLQTLVSLGVNRISLGAQSFDDARLALLERDHRGEQIAQAVDLARDWGIDAIAIDLIFAVPGQSVDQWQRDLEAALALAPDHVSTYGLTFEKGATFYGRLQRGLLAQLPEETERAMFEAAIDTLTAAGLEHYEVSNFARPGKRSRHNEVYWTGRPYLAFGPGAARYIDGRREMNHRSVTTYLHRTLAGTSPVAESEQLSPKNAARERLVFGLRRLEGVSLSEFMTATGFGINELVETELKRFIEFGFLEIVDDRLRLTREGLMVSDSLWPEFL